MSITPLTFTGISQYSTDFQTILNRAVQIAQIPVQQLQNKDSDVLQRKTLLGGLSTAVSGLSDALGALGKIGAGQALAASSSDSEQRGSRRGRQIATSGSIPLSVETY